MQFSCLFIPNFNSHKYSGTHNIIEPWGLPLAESRAMQQYNNCVKFFTCFSFFVFYLWDDSTIFLGTHIDIKKTCHNRRKERKLYQEKYSHFMLTNSSSTVSMTPKKSINSVRFFTDFVTSSLQKWITFFILVNYEILEKFWPIESNISLLLYNQGSAYLKIFNHFHSYWPTKLYSFRLKILISSQLSNENSYFVFVFSDQCHPSCLVSSRQNFVILKQL